MPPTLDRSTRGSFTDAERSANADAAAYYAGGDTYVRSRTYSSVRNVFIVLNFAHVFNVVSTSRLQSQTSTSVPRGLTYEAETNVTRREECDSSETFSD